MNFIQLLGDSDPQNIKARLSLAAVVQVNGVELRPEGERLVGLCPFHEDHDASFAVWSPEEGVELCGCWACDFKPGDVYDFIMRSHNIGFAKAVQVALAYDRDSLTGPVIPERDPNAPAPDYSAVIREARLRNLGQLHELLTTKEIAAPADWVSSEFRVGVGEQGDIIIPHIGRDGELRGAKWRTCERKPVAMPGTKLDALYGAWRDHGRTRVILCEGESDTWLVSWLLRDEEYDVLGLPSGVSARPREEWVEQLRNRDVTLLFDADDAGRRGAVSWTAALNGASDSVRVASLPNGDDAVTAGETATRLAISQAWRFIDPSGLAITRANGRYVRINAATGSVTVLSDFVLDVERLIVNEGEGAIFEVSTEMLDSTQLLTSSELGNQQRMREWMASRLLSWKGGTRDIADLLEVLKAESLFVPRVRGTGVIGLHDDTFVLPDCTIGSPGWGYIPPAADVGLGAMLSLCESGGWDSQVPFVLAQLHSSDVITPIIGWVAAAPLRSLCAQFPTLAVVGGAGWGKTTLIETVLRAFGFWMTSPMTLTATTKHGVQSFVAATNAFPVWFDEYRHGANPDTKLAVDQLIRDAWDGSSSVKGGYGEDKVAIRRLPARAPMLVTGEDAFSETSHAERMVLLSIPMEGKNPQALTWMRDANSVGFGRAYLEWLAQMIRRGELPAPPVRSTRMELARATAEWGWSLLRDFVREATGRDMCDFDDTRILAEHTAMRDSPLIVEALKDALDRRSADGYKLVWAEGEDICVRTTDFVRWVKRDTDYTLPGGSDALKRWLRERWPNSLEYRDNGVRFVRLYGATDIIV